VINQMSVIENF